MTKRLYWTDELEEYQIDIKHKYHDTRETFEVYECETCKSHFLVESDTVESVDFIYCPYCKKEIPYVSNEEKK